MQKKPFVTLSQVEEMTKTYPTPFSSLWMKKLFVKMLAK